MLLGWGGEMPGLSRLRNIFDQYSQPENRVTHALMTALDQDRRLLSLFLRELLEVEPPGQPETLSVLEQGYPGEAEQRGIPDVARRTVGAKASLFSGT